MKILLLMILLHIIDDFVLQKATLCDLKQKDTWKDAPRMYRNDYKVALFIHSLSWSIMIHLPLFLIWIPWYTLFCTVAINTGIHMIVDDHKANLKTINLVTDQAIHFSQILLTYGFYYIFCIV